MHHMYTINKWTSPCRASWVCCSPMMGFSTSKSANFGFSLKNWPSTHLSYVYVEQMNYSLSYSLSMLFSMWTWVLEVAFSTTKTPKFGFSLKNWPRDMYHRYTIKNWTTPCPNPWACCYRCGPGSLRWPLGSLKVQTLDSPWKIGL